MNASHYKYFRYIITIDEVRQDESLVAFVAELEDDCVLVVVQPEEPNLLLTLDHHRLEETVYYHNLDSIMITDRLVIKRILANTSRSISFYKYNSIRIPMQVYL